MELPPAWASKVITSVGGQVTRRITNVKTFTPPEGASLATRSTRETESLPINGSLVWAFGGGFSTNFSYNAAGTVDVRPDGSRTESEVRELGADVGRTFRAPASWNLKDPIRARFGFTRSDQNSFVTSLREGEIRRSRLSDNGRYSMNLNLDTDMNENMMFSLTGQRTVSYDRQFNRRFTQLVVTAVMTLQFYAGELR